jgi:hypothetical protein
VIRPRVMSDAIIHGIIRIPGTFSAKLPYRPVLAVFRVEEGDELVEGVSIGELGVGL